MKNAILSAAILAALSLPAAAALRSVEPSDARATLSPRVEREVALVFERLPEARWTEWQASVDRLSALGPAGVPALVDALGSSDRKVRTAAAHALTRISGFEGQPAHAAAVGALLVIADEDPDVRLDAYEGLVAAARRGAVFG